MRRLLASVAVLAVVLAAPSAALAVGTPVIASPQSGTATNVAAVTVTWNDVRLDPLLESVTYHVLRSTTGGASCPANPGAAPDISGPLVDVTTFPDTVSTQARYCYYVEANDLLTTADSDPALVTYDTAAPSAPVVATTGGNGCAQFVLTGATSSDNFGPVTITTGGAFPYMPPGTPFASVSATVTATDAAGNSSSTSVTGQFLDDTRPPAPALEIDTDPAQQKATLSWDISAPPDGAPIMSYRIRIKGPPGTPEVFPGLSGISPIALTNMQPDATYEFTLDAMDICGFGTTSVRLVRLNDTTPPSLPLVAQPAFDTGSHVVRLSWIPSTDNIQIDHYVILRNGVPLSATDATVFTDSTPGQHAQLSYVVRAVDTNGNESDSTPATIMTPDWTSPTAPVLTIDPQGTTVKLRWSAAADNVGVVGYDVLRDDRVKASMTAGVRTFNDLSVPPGVHTWTVRARDDEGLSAVSAPQTAKIVKPHASAKVVSLKMVGANRGGAARYSLKGPARLLLDLRVVGTIPKAVLRVYVQTGKGRITVWRGVPGSSSPRERLHSALVRHGYVTIHLGRTLHSGRIRLVLITSGRMVVVGTGKHQPSIKAG